MSVNAKIKKHIINEYADNTDFLNKLVVTAFLRNNRLVAQNQFLREHILPDTDLPDNFRKDFSGIVSLEDVIAIFEIAIPQKDAIQNGAVYTPQYIREFIITESFNKFNGDICNATFADISCGCGAFLISLAEKLHNQYGMSFNEAYSHIWGIDINSDSVLRAKILISLQVALENEVLDIESLNLFSGNTLNFDFGEKRFDIIVGNPPYVRSKHIDGINKELMSDWEVCKSGNSDLYIPFFQIGMNLLCENGVLGFITVNSFLKSLNARLLRNFFASGDFRITVGNFGEEIIFKGRLAYTCIFFAERIPATYISYAKISSEQIKDNHPISFTEIEYDSLDNHKGWNLSNHDIMDAIAKIESTGTPLGKFNIKNGIATLANDVFIFRPESEDEKYFYINSNGNLYPIEKDICRNIIKPNILKCEKDIEEKLEKVIFPYNDAFELLPESRFVSRFPKAAEYLRSHMDTLLKRDKEKCDYPWYAFGRTQALTNTGKKLLFPYMTDIPHFIYTSDDTMLIYCGYAIYSNNECDLKVLKKIAESSIFDFYMRHTAKPYSTGYYSYAKNYVKNFGVVELTNEEKETVLSIEGETLNSFLCEKYELDYSILSR